jgi:hypothetical protein
MEIAYEFKHNREKVTPCLIFMNIENEKFLYDKTYSYF